MNSRLAVLLTVTLYFLSSSGLLCNSAFGQDSVAELQSIDADIVLLQSQLSDKQQQLDKLDRTKKATDDALAKLQQQIKTLEQAVAQTAADLATNADTIKQIKAKTDATKERMLEVVRRTYMGGQFSVHQENMLVSLLQNSAKSGKDDFLRNCFYLNKVRSFDATQLQQFAEQQQQLEKAQTDRTALLQKQTQSKTDLAANIISSQKKNDEIRRSADQIRKLKDQQQSAVKSLKVRRLRFETVLASVASGEGVPGEGKGDNNSARNSFESPATTNNDLTGLDPSRTVIPVDAPIALPYGKVLEPSTFGLLFQGGEQKHAVALGSGKVSNVTRLGRFGFLVLIDHGQHFFSMYSQLDSVVVKQNDMVQAGSDIGLAGTGGLYLEVRKDGKAIDPARFFKAIEK